MIETFYTFLAVSVCASFLPLWLVRSPFYRDTLNGYDTSIEDSAYCPGYIEMCTKLPLKYGHLSNEDSARFPSYIEMCTKLPLK